MNYHGITKTSLNNGEGLRTVLWVSGCEHKCKGCHNPYSWDANSGKLFNDSARDELFDVISRPWVDGLTISGGDPLHPANRDTITELAKDIKTRFPNKNIWLYTGYTYEDVKDLEIMKYIDTIVDGRFEETLADPNYKFAGSTNQRIINIER